MLIQLKNKKLIFGVALGAIVLTAVILIQILTPGLRWLFTPSGKVKQGVLSEVDASQHIDSVPEGEIRYLINNNVYFESDNVKGNFMFENPEACKYDLQFVIYEVVGELGEEHILYTSPMIEPGYYLSGDKLRDKLEAGKYNCVYVARAYLNGKYVGERMGDLSLTVQN